MVLELNKLTKITNNNVNNNNIIIKFNKTKMFYDKNLVVFWIIFNLVIKFFYNLKRQFFLINNFLI